MQLRLGMGWCFWLASTLACGAAGSGAVASSGVRADKRIARLQDTEVRKLCEWSNSLSDTGLSAEETCTYNALLSNSPTECKQRRDACVAQSGNREPPGLLGVRVRDCSALTKADVPLECDANVEQLEACQRDLIDSMVTDAMRASCDVLGVLWTPVPASCSGAVIACTRILSGD